MKADKETSERPSEHSLSVWIVEDGELFRETVAGAIDAEPGLSCPLAVTSCEQALTALQNSAVPDIVLMDIGLPGMSGIEGVRRVRERSPETRVIMLTVHEEEGNVFEAICAGASGYLVKPAPVEEIIKAIREVAAGAAPINAYIAAKVLAKFGELMTPRGDYGLSDRERQILELLVEGLVMKQVAARLDISYHTVDTHIRNIYEKLHVRSRAEAVAKAVRERLF